MEIVLLAGFLSVAVFLYYLMSRLDNDLGRIRSSTEKTERCHLMIAVSSLYAIQFVLDTYNDIKRDYPNLEVTIFLANNRRSLSILYVERPIWLSFLLKHGPACVWKPHSSSLSRGLCVLTNPASCSSL